MKQKLLLLFAIIAWILPAYILFRDILTGSIPFWYDPARDMLSAWSNLSKVTLIGPPTGIPGIFYGPYWIWLLSFGEIFSKDPRVVVSVVQTLPYLILFPVLLYLFSRIFSPLVCILLWLIFFFSSSLYMTYLWNPDLSPLLFLAVIYLLITKSYQKYTTRHVLQMISAGILTGLALNSNLSVSVGFFLGCTTYIVVVTMYGKKSLGKKIVRAVGIVGSFVGGSLLTFVPYVLFEARHGFSQTKVALAALAHGGGVVGVQGLSKAAILETYFGKFADIVLLPTALGIGILIVLLGIFAVGMRRKKITLSSEQNHLILLLGCITFCVLGIYLLAKNPIWAYHFIGIEIIWLLFIGLITSKIKILRYILFLGVLCIAFLQLRHTFFTPHANPLTIPNLSTKEYIVNTIIVDARSSTYTVFVYSPSIYTYEYSYLFKWMAKKDFSYDPGQIQRQGIVYLVLPPASTSVQEDFIHYRTPDALYITAKSWHLPDGTQILKRVPIVQ